jgi:hypothetical protein
MRPKTHQLPFCDDDARRATRVKRVIPGPSWTRDNEFVYVPTGLVNQTQLGEAVSEAAKLLDAREVRHVRFTLGPDAKRRTLDIFRYLAYCLRNPSIPVCRRHRKSGDEAL